MAETGKYSEGWFNRLRYAQRELVDDIGRARAMELTSMGKSQVSRWCDEVSRDLVSLPTVMVLEGYARRPLITGVLAEFAGRGLTSPDENQTRIACLAGQVAELVTNVSTLMARTAAASSDGFYSVAEVNELQRLNADIRKIGEELDDVLATAKAAGGIAVVRGGAA